MLRVIALLACFFAVFVVWRARSARAAAEETGLAAGRELAQLAPLVEDTVEIVLNGQPMRVSNAVVGQSVDEVLDRFEPHCRAHSVLRSTDPSGNEGMIACFAEGTARAPGLLESFGKLGRSGDLRVFGDVRYVYARRTDPAHTHVLTASTDARFDARKVVAEEGVDVPGTDSSLAPRPDGAQRILSASIEGTPFALRIYRSHGSPDAVMAQLDETMRARGWTVSAPAPSKGGAVLTHIYTHDDTEVLLTATPSEDQTLVSIGEVDADGSKGAAR